ncbi:MAG: malto-oligosyltrehalose synthase, partial [Deltaproteobacteria bacterium]|nr:malto-oligosyltrehalose synthase [Kofleriaceae bacterium]
MTARRATYRLQLGAAMRFADVARIADTLAELGISHVYLSPVLEAAPGSTHGYDVVDHHRASDMLGGNAGFEAMCRALAARGLGVLVDIVPNHMAIGPHNAWWQDVLEHGRSSRYAGYFDVDWHPGEDADNRVLLPVLGERYADALASGVLRIARAGARMAVHYHEHRFPVAPRSLAEPMGAAGK